MWALRNVDDSQTSQDDGLTTKIVQGIEFGKEASEDIRTLKQMIKIRKKRWNNARVIWDDQKNMAKSTLDNQQQYDDGKKWTVQSLDEPIELSGPSRPATRGRYLSKPQNHGRRTMTQQVDNRRRVYSRQNSPRRQQLTIYNVQPKIQTLDQYNSNIHILSRMYESLTQMLFHLKNKKAIKDVSPYIKAYLHILFPKGLMMVDSFLQKMENRHNKLFKHSQMMEKIAICLFCLQIIKGYDMEEFTNLTSLMEYCVMSLVLYCRLYILFSKKRMTYCPDTTLEKTIRNFQNFNFKTEIKTADKVLSHMQHINKTVGILVSRVGKNNHQFTQSARDLLQKMENDSLWLYTKHILEYLAFYLHDIGLNGRIPFLDCSPGPYLMPATRKFTIVLEPLGVLYCVKQGKVRFRNYFRQFIDYIDKHFQVIIWSSMMPSDITPFVEQVKKQHFGLLYRYHCQKSNGIYTKNVNRLGRDVDNVLIVDTDQRVFGSTPQNGLKMPWSGNPHDQKLLDLSQILLQLLQNGMTVRDTLKLYEQQVTLLQN